jgi:hypothetical protein
MRIVYRMRLLFVLVFTCFLALMSGRADVWTAPSATLAQQIVAKTGAGIGVALNFANISSLSPADAGAIRKQLGSELRNRGLRIVNAGPSIPELRITLSEDVDSYLWVAEIRRGEGVDVVFTTVPRTTAVEQPNAGMMTLQRRLLWSQDEPILDVALVAPQNEKNVVWATPSAIVLTPSKVALYRIQNSAWQEADAAPITHSRPFPRDLRGMIVGAGNNSFEVLLPGLKCGISGNNPMQASCTETDDPWPIYDGQPRLDAFYSPARNFFTGVISRSGDSVNVPPFYSAAMFGNSEWLFAGTDRHIEYSNFTNTLLFPAANWGSELTSIKSKCSTDAVILATRNGDYTQPDAVQGFQVIARNPVAVTAPVEFAGPVFVLRNSGEVAIALSHNLKTGRYEAYLLSLACTQ